MHLQHLHLPGLTPYPRASAIQSHLMTQHLTHKALPPALRAQHPPPPPLLLTFQTPPTYTCGRRETGTLTPAQRSHLRAGGHAAFYESPRGGQTTFHGPGQLTGFLILDLVAHDLTARTHIQLLEQAVIDTCAVYGVDGFRTGYPGVWTSEEEKIASVGVHLRRHVAGFGVGVNVGTGLGWFDRIVACGLVGKRATSLKVKGVEPLGGVGEVAGVLAGRMAGLLAGVEAVEEVKVAEVEGLQEVVDPGGVVGSEVGGSRAEGVSGKG